MSKKAEGQAAENETEVEVLDEQTTNETETTHEGGEGQEGEGEAGKTTEAEDEVVVTIGEESPPTEEETTQAPEWVRELRRKNREDQKRIRELEEQLNAKAGAETKPATLGKKPTLEDCDYDSEKFEQELAQWYERKRQTDEQEAKIKAEQEAQQKAWQSKLDAYGKAKTELKVKDFDDAEDVVKETLSVTQQGIILQGAENPALLMYALGKNTKKAKELASITDPVKYAFAVAKLETQLKVTNRKAPPAPEKTVQGTGRVSGTVDSNLERLREEAAKTGDYTKVHRYKQQQRQAGK